MYPPFLDQLSLLESILLLGVMVSGGFASGILWQHRSRATLPGRRRGAVAGLLTLCICLFGALVISLSR